MLESASLAAVITGGWTVDGAEESVIRRRTPTVLISPDGAEDGGEDSGGEVHEAEGSASRFEGFERLRAASAKKGKRAGSKNDLRAASRSSRRAARSQHLLT